MPGITLYPGDDRVLLASAARTPATPFIVTSDDYWLPHSGGLIISINITAITAGGEITKLRIMGKHGTTYVKDIEFTTLSMTATGLYRFRVIPGATATSSWKGVASDMPPPVGAIAVEAVDNKSITYEVALECIAY